MLLFFFVFYRLIVVALFGFYGKKVTVYKFAKTWREKIVTKFSCSSEQPL